MLYLLIHQVITVNNGERVTSPTLSQSDKRSVRPSEITPQRLAIALRILEGANYKAITATDCISYLLYQNGLSKVADARVTNNKIVNWVKKSVTRSDRMEPRGDTLRFFVNTAVVSPYLQARSFPSTDAERTILSGMSQDSELRIDVGDHRWD